MPRITHLSASIGTPPRNATAADRYLRDFVHGYLDCAGWTATDEEGNPLDLRAGDFPGDVWEVAGADCVDFIAGAFFLLRDVDGSQAGHDFWLTRNRHGAGFWDRGLGRIGRELTELAHPYGEAYVFLDDVHGEPELIV